MKNVLKINNRDMRTKTRKLHFEIQINILFKVLSKDHSTTFLILLRKLSRKNVL